MQQKMFSISPDGQAARMKLAELVALFVPFAIRGVATLGVADVLAAGPAPVEKIAEALDADTEALYRTLRFTASRGVVTDLPGRVFALHPLAELLPTDLPR